MLPDDLRSFDKCRRLCIRCGCLAECMLTKLLSACGMMPRCTIKLLLRCCGKLGVQVRLPARLSLGMRQREVSWQGLLKHIDSKTSAQDAEDRLRVNAEIVEAVWPVSEDYWAAA